MTPLTYKDAGVDLDLNQQAMSRLPDLVRKTHTPRVMDLPGGFAGLFRLDFNEKLFSKNYREPVLVSGTDGVGSKVKVAIAAQVYDTVGIDLVAMCVNDCLCLGADPLFFLDYLALSADDPDLVEKLVAGVAEGCLQSQAALIGGETAIMPGIYSPGDFDMAGFCVGVAERDRILDGRHVAPGDQLIGLASSGFHSNGYSLIRKAVFDVAGLGIHDPVPELNQTVAQVLLEPTRIYAKVVGELLREWGDGNVIRAMAHITGGGLPENLVRILPEGCRLQVHCDRWTVPPAFPWLQRIGGIETDEMRRVFNMGIGYALIAEANSAEAIRQRVADLGIDAWIIGDVIAGDKGVDLIEG